MQKSPRHNLTDCSVHSAGVRAGVMATAYHLGVLTCINSANGHTYAQSTQAFTFMCIQILH